MKRFLVLIVCLVILLPGSAKASVLYVGTESDYPIYSQVASLPGDVIDYRGGSFDTSTLNGTTLAYLYGVDPTMSVFINQTYDQTVTNNTGAGVNNAAAIAWLLSQSSVTYLGTTYNVIKAGQGIDQSMLQAAIWSLNNGSYYSLYTDNYTTDQVNEYTAYYTVALSHAGDNSYISSFYWITPELYYRGVLTPYELLVAPASAAVPIPGAVWLLGSGLIGLVAIRRRFKK